MKKIGLFTAGLLLCGWAAAQNLTLNWVQTETYQQENGFNFFSFDRGQNNDIVSGIFNIWIDGNANMIHANAINRRDQQGQMLTDTMWNNNSYNDYVLKGFCATHGETYYCLNYINSTLIFEKLGTNGQLLWQQSIPRSTFFFCHDWNMYSNNYVIDDSLNNRKLWCFEQYDASWTTKSTGVLATDNTTGAITLIDTLNYSGQYNNTAFAIELERDNSGHVYFSSTDETGGMKISLIENNQLVTVATMDSAGFTCRDYPQSMEICGNTLYFTSQIEVSNNNRVNKLWIYSIGSNGHLTLVNSLTYSDTQHYLLGLRSSGNSCYLYTSGYNNFSYTSLVPTIWKYDNAGALQNTFSLSTYTGKAISAFAASNAHLYCSMYTPGYNTMEIIDQQTGAHQDSYDLLNEFTCGGNDGVHQLEVITSGAGDYVYASGNQWNNSLLFARLAKYSFGGTESGIPENEADFSFNAGPNPADDFLNIYPSKSGDYSVRIFNAAGALVASSENNTGNTSINLQGLAPGIYFLQTGQEGRTESIRFVKN